LVLEGEERRWAGGGGELTVTCFVSDGRIDDLHDRTKTHSARPTQHKVGKETNAVLLWKHLLLSRQRRKKVLKSKKKE